MEQGFGYEFYNAGDRIEEMWSFDISQSSAGFNPGIHGTDTHSLGKYVFQAPAKSWFFVPAEIASGNETVRVNFKDDAFRKFGERGVVLLDPRHDPESEDSDKPLSAYAKAPTRELAIERAEKLWDEYLLSIIARHVADCDAALAMGGRPRQATGFARRAFRLKGVTDPGSHYFDSLKKGDAPQQGVSSDVVAILGQMQDQNRAFGAALLAIASGEKIDPEMLKVMMQPTPVPAIVAAAGKPSTTGIMTGHTKETPARGDGWEKAKNAPADKKTRAQEAVKAL
jgi:hypothetical protein